MSRRRRPLAPSIVALSCLYTSLSRSTDSYVSIYQSTSCFGGRRRSLPHPRSSLLVTSKDAVPAAEPIQAIDQRPHEQRTAGPRKARRLNHPFQHLYRHDDPPHYPTYDGNSTFLEQDTNMNARRYLKEYGGYTNQEIDDMNTTFPPLLDLDVVRHLRPKMRFLKYTLGGVDTISLSASSSPDSSETPSRRTLSNLGKCVPPPFFGARLEKTVAPRHAFLQHVKLPHGKMLLENDGKLCKEFLVSSRRTKQFCALCNTWRRKYGLYDTDNGELQSTEGAGREQIGTDATIVTPEQVEAFDVLFQRGLMSAARNDIATLNSIQQYANSANITSNELVKLLASAGANPLEKDVRGISLIHWAAGAGNLDGLVELIAFFPGGMNEALSTKADRDGASPLHWAAAGAKSKEFGCGGHIDVVRFFLENCPREEAKKYVNSLTKDGNSVLMWAAWSGTLDVVKLLVRSRADAMVANRNGCTVAHWAASGGNLEVCKYLHDTVGVEFRTQNYAGNTPLSHAVAYGRADVVQWLRNDVCTEDEDGRAADLALDFVGWTDGDDERKKVYDMFQDSDWDIM